ncbi:MAG: lipoyl synthase [Bacteroidales bacterium]|nr:lipoyl synthase [Bacteroidales bacterium]
METEYKYKRKPEWLKIKLPNTQNFTQVNKLVAQHNLHTICTSGKCPNMGECWDAGTATFMILGDICTRSCKFCNVITGKPNPVDWNEPMNVAKAVKALNLKHCVLTSVDRDDLQDKGSKIWAATVKAVKQLNPNTTIETLIPDFDGYPELIHEVINARPEVISHNLETVKRLTPEIRSRAKYERSLMVLKIIADAEIIAKSGIMLGLGETQEEVLQTMDDLRVVGCSVLTIGQYLQPSKENIAVVDYVTPEIFKFYEEEGLKKGFRYVESSPLVRSSYHAEKHVH